VPQSSSPAGAGVLRVDVEIAQPAPRKRIDPCPRRCGCECFGAGEFTANVYSSKPNSHVIKHYRRSKLHSRTLDKRARAQYNSIESCCSEATFSAAAAHSGRHHEQRPSPLRPSWQLRSAVTKRCTTRRYVLGYLAASPDSEPPSSLSPGGAGRCPIPCGATQTPDSNARTSSHVYARG
jgi:hypothetical protein